MQLRPDTRIQTAIGAMTNVVLPAIDPDDALAQEQAQLVIGHLSLLAQWLPIEYRYDRDELARLLDTAEKLGGGSNGSGAPSEQLAAVAADARDVLARAGAEPRELQDAVRALRARLGEVAETTLEHGDAKSRETVARAVLDLSAEQVLRVRSVYIGHGFEGASPDVPPLAELLD